MKKEVISTNNAPGAIGPYSQAIKVGDFVYTSGQLPIDPIKGEMPETIEEQTKQALENCKAILEAAGSSLNNAVKATVYLKDIKDFVNMNEVYKNYFPSNPPARSAFQVAALPKDARVEIEIVAIINS